MHPYTALFCISLSVLAAQEALPSAPAPQRSAEVAAEVAGGTLRLPILIYQVDPALSEAARRHHRAGDVELSVVVDSTGRAQKISLRQGLGDGLDEEAIAAVKQYRWKPATQNGKPVAFEIPVSVNFQIF